jgi:hypothetical protein
MNSVNHGQWRHWYGEVNTPTTKLVKGGIDIDSVPVVTGNVFDSFLARDGKDRGGVYPYSERTSCYWKHPFILCPIAFVLLSIVCFNLSCRDSGTCTGSTGSHIRQETLKIPPLKKMLRGLMFCRRSDWFHRHSRDHHQYHSKSSCCIFSYINDGTWVKNDVMHHHNNYYFHNSQAEIHGRSIRKHRRPTTTTTTTTTIQDVLLLFSSSSSSSSSTTTTTNNRIINTIPVLLSRFQSNRTVANNSNNSNNSTFSTQNNSEKTTVVVDKDIGDEESTKVVVVVDRHRSSNHDEIIVKHNNIAEKIQKKQEIHHATNDNNNDNNDVDDDNEMEQEEMYVEPHPSFQYQHVREWGGPCRGGKYLEPTRYGDWERKGRCSDF